MSTLRFSGMMEVASHTAITTTISGATSGCTALILHVLMGNTVDIGPALNGILAGLVGITGSCSIVEPYASFFIGTHALESITTTCASIIPEDHYT